jgi:hypothetical protein
MIFSICGAILIAITFLAELILDLKKKRNAVVSIGKEEKQQIGGDLDSPSNKKLKHVSEDDEKQKAETEREKKEKKKDFGKIRKIEGIEDMDVTMAQCKWFMF